MECRMAASSVVQKAEQTVYWMVELLAASKAALKAEMTVSTTVAR